MNRTHALGVAARTHGDAKAAGRYEKLNGQLGRLLDLVESADAEPTLTAQSTVAKLLHGVAASGRIPIELSGEDEP